MSMKKLQLLLLLLLTSCAYRMGSANRTIPEGYKEITIPIFKNKSMETGIETYFTKAIVQEFIRSRVARVVGPSETDVELQGTIIDVVYTPEAIFSRSSAAPLMPEGTALASSYRIRLSVKIAIIKKSTQKILWQGSFNGERTYSAPQVTMIGVNSVNPLYNLSARRQNIDLLATDLMSEAHDRITENF